ncbi:MAG: PEP-CTERM sorting domain-containing protein [Phycisphaerae bacterium]|nr:PEP-CTERM sorting domain-containing protein [Phycisphaerae bacterium]
MKKLSIILGVAVLIATPAFAANTVFYSWEDGGTILGSYGNLVDPTNVTGAQVGQAGDQPDYTCPGACSGTYYLHVAEEPQSGTPQAYVAFIENLAENDVVDASFFGFDLTAGASPSLRIWAHYAYNGDVLSYDGSASGNTDYTAGTGWDEVSHSWTIPAGKEALVIEARLYSTPSTGEYRTDYFIDDLTVTAPDSATITVAPEPASLLLLGLAGLLIRRR